MFALLASLPGGSRFYSIDPLSWDGQNTGAGWCVSLKQNHSMSYGKKGVNTGIRDCTHAGKVACVKIRKAAAEGWRNSH